MKKNQVENTYFGKGFEGVYHIMLKIKKNSILRTEVLFKLCNVNYWCTELVISFSLIITSP